MKKILIIITLLLMTSLSNVYAEENIRIECEKNTLYNNEEIGCMINSYNMEYNLTSISAHLETTDNIEIVESSYDENEWLMLDKKFNIKDINLISESKYYKSNITIAKFKIKAINKSSSLGKIIIKDVVIGDENYEEHYEEQNELVIKLQYDKNYDNDRNKKWFITIIFASLVVIIVLYILKKRKK